MTLDAAPHTFVAESRELLRDMEEALLTLEQSPRDLDTIADLQKFLGILRAWGYREEDVCKVAHGNLVRFFRHAWGRTR